MQKTEYLNLTAEQIEMLKSNGNRAEDWNNVMVSGQFDCGAIYNNTFFGKVFIGAVSNSTLCDGDLRLPEGITGSMLRDCSVGNHCAVHNVRMLAGYTVSDHCLLFNIDEMTASAPNPDDDFAWIEPMNENGKRKILPFRGMTIGDAYMWARFRGQKEMVKKLEVITRKTLASDEGCYGFVGEKAVIKNTKCLHNVAVCSEVGDPSRIEQCVMLSDGVVGLGCKLEYGIIAERFLLGEHVKLEYGLRLNDSVVGDNSTLARCEVGNSIIFPAHEQHHNNSFLIAALVMGQSNVAAGGTLGSNHNSRTADNELSAGRGFWPGLCVSVKHSSRFASYCLMAKADYPSELNITLPFALVNNNVAKDRLEVMPAYWWMYNMYAMDRNSRKFADRDKRKKKAQNVEFDNLAPDTAEEIIVGRDLLHIWAEEANREGRTEIVAHGMEKGKRKTVVLKAGEGYKAYYDMLVFYAMKNLVKAYPDSIPDRSLGDGTRITNWVNIGGQLVAEPDLKALIGDIENGTLDSWDAIHARFNQLWKDYDAAKLRHAYQVLCHLSQKKVLDEAEWQKYCADYKRILQFIEDQKVITRKKDNTNEFRRMTYWNDAEYDAVLG